MKQVGNFFGMISRMKHVNRWSLMQCMREENLCEHSFEVSVIAHALAIIGNKKCGKSFDASKVALMALYHDASEVVTGDLPTPVKYSSPAMQNLFHALEDTAVNEMIDMLPFCMQDEYRSFFVHCPEDIRCWELVKAADKISALIKAQEECIKYGNHDFDDAYHSLLGLVLGLNEDLPEVKYFLDHFYDGYGKTLDQLRRGDDVV